MELLEEGVIPFVKIPINPDAYINFNELSMDAAIQDEKVEDQDLLKQVGLKLQDEIIVNFFQELEDLDDGPKNSKELTHAFHKRGINIRYLGRMATEIKHNFLKEIAVREILARAIKVLIRDGLSFLKDEPNGFTIEDVKKCVLHYLNEILTL